VPSGTVIDPVNRPPVTPIADPALFAAPPLHELAATIQLNAPHLSNQHLLHLDRHGLDGETGRHWLPAMTLRLVTDGGALIPVDRGLLLTNHPVWDVILEPGRAWHVPGDAWSTASLPITLVERNQNCTHHGAISFQYTDVDVSAVSYAITQETCPYYQIDLWGVVDAQRLAAPFLDPSAARAQWRDERSAMMPTLPLSSLATDYGVDPNDFMRSFAPQSVTAFGVVAGGVHYRGDCQERNGPAPFCGRTRIASYSTAKSAFAALAAMRIAKTHGDHVRDAVVSQYVPEHTQSPGDWSSVSLEHLLDMSTGHFRRSPPLWDERSPAMDAFFTAETSSDKLHVAFSAEQRATPGTWWVYRTSDTFIAGALLQRWADTQSASHTDLFDLVVQEIYEPLALSPGAKSTRRTTDGAAFAGYGLFWTPDDVAKLAQFLSTDLGVHQGHPLVDRAWLRAALQRDPTDRGVDVPGPRNRYNDGFWARHFGSAQGLSCEIWVPYMSGHGGITVALPPNGVAYYQFADDFQPEWETAVLATDNIVPLCP